MALSARDERRREKAIRAGANYARAIIEESRRAGITQSMGFALIEQESGFRNVFGHDPTIFAGAGTVTKGKYLAYKRQRGPSGRGGMQGIGPAQLTWWEYQDAADRLGGCWIARNNIRVGFTLLAALISRHGERKGLAVYNGGARTPNCLYADQVLARRRKWHTILNS